MEIYERAKKVAKFMVDSKATVRQTAKEFGISKSTVHKDITYRLKKVDSELYQEAIELLNQNRTERHIRGGMATRERWRKLKENL